MRIRIGVWTFSNVTSADIDDETKVFSVNGTEVPFSQGFLYDAISIVKKWPDHIEDKEKTDGVVYKITYNDGQEERTVTGNNKTPEDFELLMYMLGQHTPKTEKQRKDEEFLRLISEYRMKRYKDVEDREAEVKTDEKINQKSELTDGESEESRHETLHNDVWEREW